MTTAIQPAGLLRGKRWHDDADVASKAGDIGTADLYTRLVQVHQKARWFLKAIARRD